ncbi:hypothetical protein NLJ89_g3728 [Agrocybe chaxingu]|uniref:Uncharacterized protein n=1 Tax=Agrocybe chaxingu TaxID=84603 RepID=A0A9W8K4D4_9AGAR|nr:hypothetical protein NLJ89_g3728 [Agrocybe chaxingu]
MEQPFAAQVASDGDMITEQDDHVVPDVWAPYRVDTDVGQPRGEQKGYNICNSTTEGPSSLCQTAFINSLDDFCLWAPAEPGHTVGDIEGEMIAWCTNPDTARASSPMALSSESSSQSRRTGDAGGEMDPHGADRRGNPMGGLLFTNAWTGGMIQSVEWHNFNGANIFCLKACDPHGRRAPQMCEHIYDTQGCGFYLVARARAACGDDCWVVFCFGAVAVNFFALFSGSAHTCALDPFCSANPPIPFHTQKYLFLRTTLLIYEDYSSASQHPVVCHHQSPLYLEHDPLRLDAPSIPSLIILGPTPISSIWHFERDCSIPNRLPVRPKAT